MLGIYLVCYVLFPLSILPFCRRKDKPADVLLNKDETNVIKGLAAVFIVLAHMVIRIEEELQNSFLLLKPITVLGGMGVLLFFFLSGYGLYKGYSNRKIGREFIKKRLTTTYIPYVFMKVILLIINVLLGYKEFVISEMEYLFWGDWFIEVIMIQYLVFFASKKIQEKLPQKGVMIPSCFILTLILGIIFVISGKPAGWYNALLLFPFGLLAAKYEKKLMAYLDRAYWRCMILSTICFGIAGGAFAINKGNMWANGLKTVAGIMLVCMVILICRYLDICSPIMKYFGTRSMYVYVIHVSILDIMTHIDSVSVLQKSVMLLAGTVVGVASIYFLYHKLEQIICKRVFRDHS